MPGLCGRAVYLARAGRTEEALAEAKRILALSDTPFTQYLVGCVYALASAKNPALADADLATLRGRPAFEPLRRYVKHLRLLQNPASPSGRPHP